MQVLYKSIYIIKPESDEIEYRDIPETIDTYIKELIEYVSQNNSVREYKIISEQTEVISCVKQGITCQKNNEVKEIEEYCMKIANRLLMKEIEAQERVDRLKIKLKKGSLLQVILKDEQENVYTYLIAKVEHSNFFDDFDFSRKTGFDSDQKKIWKSCIFRCLVDKTVKIDEIKIYLDGKATYWHKEFLELKEMTTDEENTKKAFSSIDKMLIKKIKKESGFDYSLIRNAFAGYMKKPRHIDYQTMLDEILDEYESHKLDKHTMNDLKMALMRLPDTKKFERQFNSVPKEVRARIKKTYQVNTGIELRINNHVDDLQETITADCDEKGNKYIKIRTNDDEIFNDFRK